MTPERWRQIDDLFDAAVRLDPAMRDDWLRVACDGDDPLRAEVSRLLELDNRAIRNGFLTPLPATDPPQDPTASWPTPPERRHQGKPWPDARPEGRSADDTRNFKPRAAIAGHTGPHAISEPRSVVRARLRELPIIYILILGISIFWRRAVLGEEELTLYQVDAVVILALVGMMDSTSAWFDPRQRPAWPT